MNKYELKHEDSTCRLMQTKCWIPARTVSSGFTVCLSWDPNVIDRVRRSVSCLVCNPKHHCTRKLINACQSINCYVGITPAVTSCSFSVQSKQGCVLLSKLLTGFFWCKVADYVSRGCPSSQGNPHSSLFVMHNELLVSLKDWNSKCGFLWFIHILMWNNLFLLM